MKYQLHSHGWPIGDRLIPVGTVIKLPPKEGDDWSALAQGKPIPLNAVPLDDEAYQAMLRQFHDWQISRVGDCVRRRPSARPDFIPE
jgi:hypothetical protein